MTLKQVAEKYGLTPEGVDYALEQYQTVVCEITHGMLSKLTYNAQYVLQTAQERWCNTCELKEQESINITIPQYCPHCGRTVIGGGTKG